MLNNYLIENLSLTKEILFFLKWKKNVRQIFLLVIYLVKRFVYLTLKKEFLFFFIHLLIKRCSQEIEQEILLFEYSILMS